MLTSRTLPKFLTLFQPLRLCHKSIPLIPNKVHLNKVIATFNKYHFSSEKNTEDIAQDNEKIAIEPTSQEATKDKKAKSLGTIRANAYSFIMMRVVSTCAIYMDSTEEQKSNMKETSRFYYVKSLDSLDPEKKESFRNFLEEIRSGNPDEKFKVTFTRPNKKKKKDSEGEENRTYEYWYPQNYYNKTEVSNFLKRKDNGAILRGLILQFLDTNNSDLQLFLDLGKDERRIGEIVEFNKKSKKHLESVLRNDLAFTRKRFMNLDRQMYR